MGRKKAINKEECGEGCCFVCKEGGQLRICDYKDCLKAYHPECVGKDDSFLASETTWNCEWHSCFICDKKRPKFHCFCCPRAVCGGCLCDAEFVIVRHNRGFCNHCLALAGIIEGIEGAGSEEKIDFEDSDTYEFLFKSYYMESIKCSEHITPENVRSAFETFRKGNNYGYGFSEEEEEKEEQVNDSCDDNPRLSDSDEFENSRKRKRMSKRNRKKGTANVRKGNARSRKIEFIGWGSKVLFEFLSSIGKDTAQTLSQNDVATIITGYCDEHMLFHPEKKKKVVCDARLHSLLGRKSVNKNSIYKLLTAHFAENFDQSEAELVSGSEDKCGNNILIKFKRQRKSSSDIKPQCKEVVPEVEKSCFASIISENIKLVYLKRSLLEELSKQPEAFANMVMGSFVRAKADPYDYSQKNSHLLLQVIGMKRNSRKGDQDEDIVLHFANMPDVPLGKLSDADFTEEECKDLCQRIQDSHFKRPTVVEFQEKARSLHEVITKHWIQKELLLLNSLIDQANEKGWRRELSEYLERRELLWKPEEQSRLLSEVPEVIADAEVEPFSKGLSGGDVEQKNSSENSALAGLLTSHGERIKDFGLQNDGPDVAGDKHSGCESSHSADAEFDHPSNDDQTREDPNTNGVEEGPQSEGLVSEKKSQIDDAVSSKTQEEPILVEQEELKKQNPPSLEIIELSDDEEEEIASVAASSSKAAVVESLDAVIWHVTGPCGMKSGPHSMSFLKKWIDSCLCDVKFKVRKTGQSHEEAVFLTDAIRQHFDGK